MRKLIVIFVLSISSFTIAQNNWILQWEIPIDSTSIWDVDPAKNLVLLSQQSISKYDKTGKKGVQQSIKSIGEITKIDASNLLKIAVFSEDQQSVCFFDNTLSLQSDCIDLSSLDINLATGFCTSIQTDRIWIYDQLNSQLQLITLRSSQRQIIQNINTLTGQTELKDLQEISNQLFLIDTNNRVAQLDNFGTLLADFTFKKSQHIQPIENGFLIAENRAISGQSFDSEENHTVFELPAMIEGTILDFKQVGNALFVRCKTKIWCFELKQ